MNTVVAIDGPSASGKSTTARLVAQHLGFLHLDTGAMYRAVTLACNKQALPPDPSPQMSALLDDLDIRFERDPAGSQRVLLNGTDVSQLIRAPEINRTVSSYSALPMVRERLVKLQRKAAAENDVVCEGRDIGTRVFPGAAFKFFIVADIQIRARRRQQELLARGHEADLAQLEIELQRRDAQDSAREHSPLVQADDAIVVDTSDMTIEEQVATVIAHIEAQLKL